MIIRDYPIKVSANNQVLFILKSFELSHREATVGISIMANSELRKVLKSSPMVSRATDCVLNLLEMVCLA